MRTYTVALLVLILLLVAFQATAHAFDEMPPLLIDYYLPAIYAEPTLPEFPPCECDPGDKQCICQQ